MRNQFSVMLLLAVVGFSCVSPIYCSIWQSAYRNLFSTSSSSSTAPPSITHAEHNTLYGTVSEFSMQGLESDRKGIKMLENARTKLASTNSCWQNAYRNLFASCADIISDKERQSRLAWHLSDCFQRDSGRSAFPTCEGSSSTGMVRCLRKLDELEHKIYLEFFLETNSICHQLQADAFKHDTERLVNDLMKSARYAEDKLEVIEGMSGELLQESNEIHDSLASINIETQRMIQASSNIHHHISSVLKHSEAIMEQAKGIAGSQAELKEGQIGMKDKMESSIAFLRESYESLGDGMEKLKQGAFDIEKEIKDVGNYMSAKMEDLQSTANDIGIVAGASLEKQKSLLEGQANALQGLEFLTNFQSHALQESRSTLQKLADFGHKQQEELLKKQDQIQQAHNRLIKNSQSILDTQKEFEMRQANIFSALEKLFALHNAILVESRLIKSFIFYAGMIFLVYMLTSTKQTFAIRARLYLGLCLTFILELVMLRYMEGDFDQQTWILSKSSLARSSFLALASFQILYSIFTFRDYEMLNHRMLQSLVDKLSIIEKRREGNLRDENDDSDLSGYSWIVKELPEDEDVRDDPNYLYEEVAENSITTFSASRNYNLRPRKH